MFYAKISLPNGGFIKVNAGEVEFSAVCDICGKEFIMNDRMEEMPPDYDFYNHGYHCDDCDKAVKPYIVSVKGKSYSVYHYAKILAEADIESDLFKWALSWASQDELDIVQAYAGSNANKNGYFKRFEAICDEQNRRREKQEVHI